MIQVHLEELVGSAKARREAYFDYFHDPEIFELIKLRLEDDHKIQVKTEDFDSIIEESLKNRSINYLAELDSIPKSQVAILGETYHFVYKFTLRNHEYRNPLNLLRLTFEALEPIDNEYVAKFLYGMCDLMPKDSTKKRSDIPHIATFFEKILPTLFEEYKNALKEIERHKGNDEQYKHKKDSVDSFYKKSLDIAFELTLDSTKHKRVLDWRELQIERENRKIRQDLRSIYVVNNTH